MTPPEPPDIPRDDDAPTPRVPEDLGVPYEQEQEVAAPRRAASAEFVVDSQVGSQAMLREAMDPANQSLAEALRLSFRVLQVVILVLIVLFVFSGVQTVEDGQTGVLLRWGKILPVDGSPALQPGLHFSRWPYPAGEFVLFDHKNRVADVDRAFWPDLGNLTLQQAVQGASVNQRLRPGRDGSVLTSGGDIAHIRAAAQFDIDMPERYVHCLLDDDADPRRLDAERLVQLALERAIVHIAAERDLQGFVDLTDGGETELLRRTQRLLDRVDCGIGVVSIELPVDPTPALAIKKAYGELQEAKVRAEETIQAAIQDARVTLLGVAGPRYPELVEAIEGYEDAYDTSDGPQREVLLQAVNERLLSEQTTGEVASRIAEANAFRELIEGTLGAEARRFAALLPQYRAQPDFVVRRLWYDTLDKVLERRDVEIYYAPADGGVVTISLAGLQHIRNTRREMRLERQKRGALIEGLNLEDAYIRRARDMREGPGRQLNRDASGLGGS